MSEHDTTEGRATTGAARPPAVDDGGWIEDLAELGDDPCSWCGGHPDEQECDDPIQCCDPRCDGQYHPCTACNGTGLARNQVIW